MIRKYSAPLAVLLCTMIFTACQKNFTADLNDPGNGFTNSADSNYLSKQTFVERSAGGLDTGAVYYHFDAQKRVSSIASHDLGSTASGGFGYDDSTSYFYHGSDSLPYRELIYDYNSTYNDTTDRYLSYSAAGKLVKDSITYAYSYGSDNVRIKQIGNYTYNGSVISHESHETILSDPGAIASLNNTIDTITLDSRGNAVRLREIDMDEFGNTLQDYIQTFTYDLKPSPYLKLNINNIFPVLFGADYEYSQLGSRNNRLTWREEIPGLSPPGGTLNYDGTGAFIFGASGYPTMMFIPGFSTGEYEKFLYEYRVL